MDSFGAVIEFDNARVLIEHLREFGLDLVTRTDRVG